VVKLKGRRYPAELGLTSCWLWFFFREHLLGFRGFDVPGHGHRGKIRPAVTQQGRAKMAFPMRMQQPLPPASLDQLRQHHRDGPVRVLLLQVLD
jgi:hypothetical protein